MIINDKELYTHFCKVQKKLPIYFNDWYLDSVCGKGKWDVLLYLIDKKIIAVMPYYPSLLGMGLFGKKLAMPKITPYMGVYFLFDEDINITKKLSEEKKIMSLLIEALPKHSYFNMRFHESIKNWLPFYWKGFSQTNFYTYVIKDLTNLDLVYSNFRSSVRNKIRKADKLVKVEISEDIEAFYQLNKMTFERQSLSIGYSKDFLIRQDKALKANNARTIFFAKDLDNRLHSALYLTHDLFSVNIHLVGENPDLRNSGAGTLLVWEAIKYTRNTLNLNRFNFEGSMIENIEANRRSFGAEQVCYFKISKVKSRILKSVFFILDLIGKN